MTTSRALAAATAALTAALSAMALAAPAAATGPMPTVATTVAGSTCDADTCRYVFPADVFTPQTFVVPEGVTQITADLVGSRGRSWDVPGGAGGALRTTVPVSAGETLTAQIPRWDWDVSLQVPTDDSDPGDNETVAHSGGELAALYRGTGAGAAPLAVAGGGGMSGSAGAGGAGGGWHPDPAEVLRGQDGQGIGAGRGASPTAGGGVYSGKAVFRGKPGQGPAGGPGGRGVGGWTGYYRVKSTWMMNPEGGMGWYGGGSSTFVVSQAAVGGAGGGSGYLAAGLTAQQVPAATVAEAGDHGTVVLAWAAPDEPVVLEPFLVAENGDAISGTLSSRTFAVGAAGLPAGARVSVTSRPIAGDTAWGTVGTDGTVRVPYTLPFQEYTDAVWLAVEAHVDDESVAAVRLDLHLPALEATTALTVPAQVTAGEPLTLEIARIGTQFGVPTGGLSPATLVGLVREGVVTILLDGEPVLPVALTLPETQDVPSSGTAPVTLTAPAGAGEHTVTVAGSTADARLQIATTTRTFTVVVAAATPAPTAEATPAAVVVGPPPAIAATPTPTAAPAERSEVLAAGSTAGRGMLAATGAQVTSLVVLAVALIGIGVVALRARGSRRAAR